jgi:hypothetical protein
MAAISTIIAAGAAIAGTAGTIANYKQGKAARKAADGQAEKSLLAERNAKIERANAESQAAQLASSKLAAKNRSRQASSLLAPDAGEVGVTAGKTLLGQ